VYGAISKPNDLRNTLGKYPRLVIVDWKDVMLLLLEGKVTLDIIKCAHDELIPTFPLQKNDHAQQQILLRQQPLMRLLPLL